MRHETELATSITAFQPPPYRKIPYKNFTLPNPGAKMFANGLLLIVEIKPQVKSFNSTSYDQNRTAGKTESN